VIFEAFAGEPSGEEGPRRREHRLRPEELRAAFDGFEIFSAREREGDEPELASIVVRRPWQPGLSV
jgi:hypothetical protein